MAATTTQVPSKSAKKKAAKAAERTESPAPSSAADKTTDTANDTVGSPYIRELQKNIRNINKKLTNTSRTDSLIAEHKGKSLDDLVAAKVINADQKAQILKKPALQAQLAQTEEQLAQLVKIDEQYRAQIEAERAEREKAVEAAKASGADEAQGGSQDSLRNHLLLISQFLRLAAHRREEGQDPESDESQAIEGALLAVYAGDETAVDAMLKLVEGSNEQLLSVPGEQLQTTWGKVKSLTQEYKSAMLSDPEPQTEVATDPTVAHATASELESGDLSLSNGNRAEAATNGISNAAVDDGAANAVAESHWDTANEMSGSQEWVDVKIPRDPSETETGLNATPAETTNTQSWADDHPEPVQPAAPASADPNDGFHQVQRNRGRHEREGSHGFRGGRGGRGQWRGRGRGDGSGRGGRGNRNSGPNARGGRRSEES